MEKHKKFWIALLIYVLLGLLIWTTLDDIPISIGGGRISIRVLALVIIAFFAVKTVLHWKAERIRDDGLSNRVI